MLVADPMLGSGSARFWLTPPKKFWISAGSIQFTLSFDRRRQGIQRVVWTSF
jgi:hypothetical protein